MSLDGAIVLLPEFLRPASLKAVFKLVEKLLS